MSSATSARKSSTFRSLLLRPELSFLMEAHNGLSARIVEESGFEGIWASGLSMSAALGIRDRNEASWTQVLEVLEFMADATRIPILVDGDTGHGDFNTFSRLVGKLIQRGIAAVCIEDKLFPKANSFLGEHQPLADIDEFCGKIKAGKDSQTDPDFSILARVEALIAGHGMAEALKRAEAYRLAGADGILIHSKRTTGDEVLEFAREWADRAPLVVVPTTYYATPTEHFRKARISTVIWANHNLRAAMQAMRETSRHIFEHQSVLGAEERIASVRDVFEITGDLEFAELERRYLPATGRGVRAVVLAASRGNSLADLTRERPKCMLDIRGRPLLTRLVDTLRATGIEKTSVVGGYKADAIAVEGIDLVLNTDWAETGELASLAIAADALEGRCLVSYGDIYFRDFVARRLLDSDADVTLALAPRHVDRKNGDFCRCSAPYSDDPFDDGNVTLRAIGGIAPDKAHGEWIGLAAFSAVGAAAARAEIDRMRDEGALASANMPDLFNRLLAAGITIRVHYIDGQWCNVNDVLDLADLRNML